MSQPCQTVLITGCSSGIGRATARLLAREGFHVLAGVQNDKQMAELEDASLPSLQPLLLDVTDGADIDRAIATAAERTGGLFALVNNAGVGLPAAVELTTLDEVRRVLEVNTIAPLRLIQRCLPLLRTGHGRVVNMSSLNGMLALPTVGVYSASKFALEAISDTLRVELRPWDIPVSLIRPGQVSTAIFDKARVALQERSKQIPEELRAGYDPIYASASRFNERGAKSATSPEVIARAVLRALRARKPKACYNVGFDAKGTALVQWIMPRWLLDRILARVTGVLDVRR